MPHLSHIHSQPLRPEISRLEAAVSRMGAARSLIFVVGHPGTGKTALTQKFSELPLRAEAHVFRVDEYVRSAFGDWEKAVAKVWRRGEDECLIMPRVNRAAFSAMLSRYPSVPLIIWDGGGLIEDLSTMAKDAGFSAGFIMVDCEQAEFTSRLSNRVDHMRPTEKTLRERLQNLEAVARVPGIVIRTDHMELEQPAEQLRALINFAAEQCEKIAKNASSSSPPV